MDRPVGLKAGIVTPILWENRSLYSELPAAGTPAKALYTDTLRSDFRPCPRRIDLLPRLGSLFSRIAQKILPDPIVIACGLTLLVAGSVLVFPQSNELLEKGLRSRTVDVAELWFEGLWSRGFLVFALQMCLVLLTGYGLAKAPPVTALLRAVVSRIQSNRAAVMWVAVVSCVGCWINWGFGLIAAGILASEVRGALNRKGIRCQYSLIVAGAYAGMMIWHGGLSGSAPLKVADTGVMARPVHNDEAIEAVDIGRTILSTGNLVLSAVFILGIPLLLRCMATSGANTPDDPPDQPSSITQDLPSEPARATSMADRLSRSRLIPTLIAFVGLGTLGNLLFRNRLDAVDIDFVNTLFLILGLLLHRNLVEYVEAVAEGGRAVTGIILQFPLYSGIQNIMFKTGLASAISGGFVESSQWAADTLNLSSSTTFPVAAFLSAGLVNLFVPSGGGQWIVQGPIMCGAGGSLSVPIEQTVMAVSYGDQWTNMIQPFWAIPLMGLTGVNVRQFMGYCALLMVLATPVFMVGLVLLY
ncbi:MAG: TIGR00366 family protein [Phycisphaerales bacterium]|nr:TIGR00366 family protein [Phycisphaerales bacterium]